MPSSTQLDEHSAECVETLGDLTPENITNVDVPTMYRLTPQQREIVYACQHWSHDIQRQMDHR